MRNNHQATLFLILFLPSTFFPQEIGHSFSKRSLMRAFKISLFSAGVGDTLLETACPNTNIQEGPRSSLVLRSQLLNLLFLPLLLRSQLPLIHVFLLRNSGTYSGGLGESCRRCSSQGVYCFDMCQAETVAKIESVKGGDGGRALDSFVVETTDTVFFIEGKTSSIAKYAGTEIEFNGVNHLLLKEDDIIGFLETDDIKDLQPLNDRLLIEVAEADDKTAGGVLLTDSAKEKPVVGTVKAVGPGSYGEDGVQKPLDIITGNKVMYSKHAGNDFKTKDGSQYVVVKAADVLAVLS